MNRSGWRSHLTALITALIACVGLLSLSSAPAWAAAGTITEFPTPTANSGPVGITAGPDGNLWFTETATNKIGRITTGGAITEFTLPTTCGSSGGCGPYAITAGPDGNLWFTETVGKIGRITTAGSITEFHIKTKNSFPAGITAGPDGNLWFTEFNVNTIGRITPSGSFPGAFGIPTAKSGPRGITAGPDGNLWFVEQNASKIGRITTS